jgi:superfamily II DNA or RNA helicase
MSSKHNQASLLISQGIFDDLKSFREFELRVSSLSDLNSKAQGDAFEIFVEAYLATQPILQCEETWIVGDIPVDIREKLNLPRDTKGIDGVYRSALGTLVPYQVKFRSHRPALGFSEVAPFLGVTEKAIDRLLITNCDSIAIDVQNRTGVRSLRGVDFDQLKEQDFIVIEDWLKKIPKQRKSINPDPYQLEALESISSHFLTNDRGTVVMACGTGKTLVALWAVEQSKSKSILVLVPSLTLLQQTLEEWSIHNSWRKDFSYLCVCSDPSVNLKNDEVEIDPSDVPFRIDTDPEIVRRYLAQDNGKIKLIFSTYHSSHIISQATKGIFNFDFAIFDEAHKTTGSSVGRFAFALHDENIKIKKRLFLTATPKHYDINKRDKDGEFKFVSMDDVSVYGSRAHTLLFGDAVAKGIICPYKVVITLIDKKQIDDFALKNGITLVEGDAVRSKWVAGQIAVSSAIKHTSASKIITFHSRVRSAREFASDDAQGIKKFIDGYDVFHVHGKQRSNERKDTITKFKQTKKSLITNARCLTEGVDVPAVDMVAFIDPRHSKIDIAQAVGRAMRKPRGGSKQFGYIVVPIYAEDTDENSLEDAIKGEGFDDVALILNSLLEQDNELVEIIRELKESTGRAEIFNLKLLKEKVEVIGPAISLDTLSSSIYTEIIVRLGSSWDEWYGLLKRFHNREKTCLVPHKHFESEHALGIWVQHQRAEQKTMATDRLARLNDLGFIWDVSEHQWEIGFNALLKFIDREGNSLVPAKHFEGEYPLGQWVTSQRKDIKKVKISSEHMKRLSSVGFLHSIISEHSNYLWANGLSMLEQFFKREGHCNIPAKHVENDFLLGRWVSMLRKKYIKGLIQAEQLEKLSLFGFVWDPLGDLWEKGFQCLVEFKLREGHCFVHTRHKEGEFNLGQWVSDQRKNKLKGLLSEERQKKLETLGFSWVVRDLDHLWEDGYTALAIFKHREGHCNVPMRHLEGSVKLGLWVSTQRTRRRKGRILDSELERLKSIGFIWDPNESNWLESYRSLVNFVSREGHFNVPRLHKEGGIILGMWIQYQLKKLRENKLSEDQVVLLKNLGIG